MSLEESQTIVSILDSRFSGFESRITGLESRMIGLESSMSNLDTPFLNNTRIIPCYRDSIISTNL